MNSPLFSILIANYNNGNYFKDCYQSIVSQSYKNWECVIVDDASTDNSLEIINNLIKDDSRFRVFHNDKNRGCGYTKNRCAELSNGKICGFVDPDDSISDNALEIMVNHHIEEPDSTLIYSNFIYCDENLTPTKVKKNEQVPQGDSMFFNLNGNISHFSTFKKNIYNKTNGINKNLQRAVDQDLYLKLYEKGNVMHIVYDLYHYRIHSRGISTNSNTDKAHFWHWKVIIDAAERRNINIENFFFEYFVRKNKYRQLEDRLRSLKNSRLLKLLYKLGIFKAYKYL